MRPGTQTSLSFCSGFHHIHKPGLVTAFLAGLLCFLVSSCGLQAENLNVVVFNYWPRPMADVYVDGQHVGAGFGAYGPGGTGGKISCCHEARTGKVEIKWMLGGGEDDPMTGNMMSAVAELKEIKPNARYLGVYLYPDGTVALDTARGIPDERLPLPLADPRQASPGRKS